MDIHHRTTCAILILRRTEYYGANLKFQSSNSTQANFNAVSCIDQSSWIKRCLQVINHRQFKHGTTTYMKGQVESKQVGHECIVSDNGNICNQKNAGPVKGRE